MANRCDSCWEKNFILDEDYFQVILYDIFFFLLIFMNIVDICINNY